MKILNKPAPKHPFMVARCVNISDINGINKASGRLTLGREYFVHSGNIDGIHVWVPSLEDPAIMTTRGYFSQRFQIVKEGRRLPEWKDLEEYESNQ